MGQNTKKYITFSVPILKKLDNGKSIKYKIKFIDSLRSMSSLLSNLVDNLSDGLHGDKCMDCKSYLDYISVKNNRLVFRFFECKKIITKPLIKNVLKDLQIYENTYEFCNGDII